mmetsp:Transcript_60659/g.149153  ORF Transcript_60659/g.149153 Transcript_60659/m.149153 type:complete len:371 (+) Transcript_60659:244-1356(+)
MSSPHSSGTSSDGGAHAAGGAGFRVPPGLGGVQSMLGLAMQPGSSLQDYCNPALTAGGAFCGAFGMDASAQGPPSSTSAHASMEHSGNSSSSSSSSGGAYRASPPANSAAAQPWALPFGRHVLGGAPSAQQLQQNYAMNLMLLQAAAAAQLAKPLGEAAAGAGAFGPFQPAGLPPADDVSGIAAQRKNAMLEAENKALRQRLQRDAEKMNLVQMLFTQMQQNGAAGVGRQGHGGHAVPNLAPSSSSDEDTKPRPSQSRYWTEEEHQRFLDAVKIYGAHDHKAIAAKVGTRTSLQVRSHSQKFLKKLEVHKGSGLPSMNRKKKHLSAQSLNMVAGMGGKVAGGSGSGSASGGESAQPAADAASQNDVEVEG